MMLLTLSGISFACLFACVTAAAHSQCQQGAAECFEERRADYESLMQSHVDLFGGDAPMKSNAAKQSSSTSAHSNEAVGLGLHGSAKAMNAAPIKSMPRAPSASEYFAGSMAGVSFLVAHLNTKSSMPIMLLCLLLGCFFIICLIGSGSQLRENRDEVASPSGCNDSWRTPSDDSAQRPMPSIILRPGASPNLPSRAVMPQSRGAVPPLLFGAVASNRPSMTAFSDRFYPVAAWLSCGGFMASRTPRPPPQLPQMDNKRLNLAPLLTQAPPPLCPSLAIDGEDITKTGFAAADKILHATVGKLPGGIPLTWRTKAGAEQTVWAFLKPLGLVFTKDVVPLTITSETEGHGKDIGVKVGWVLTNINYKDVSGMPYNWVVEVLKAEIAKLPPAPAPTR